MVALHSPVKNMDINRCIICAHALPNPRRRRRLFEHDGKSEAAFAVLWTRIISKTLPDDGSTCRFLCEHDCNMLNRVALFSADIERAQRKLVETSERIITELKGKYLTAQYSAAMATHQPLVTT